MVRDNRIKHYGFTASQLTADDGGTIADAYSDIAINGTLKKIIWKFGTIANNGSVGILISGTGERLWTFLDANTDQIDYPMTYGVTTARASGSPAMATELVIDSLGGVLQVWGSGCGSATTQKAATSLTICYE